MKRLANSVRSYWRIYLLVIVTIVSLGIIFSPVIPGYDVGEPQEPAEGEPAFDQKYTSLQYSIELAGGTRIRAPLIGVTAEGADIGDQSIPDLEQSIADDFEDTDDRDVTVIEPEEDDAAGNTTIEITSDVSTDDVEQSLDDNNVTYDSVGEGVTDSTRDEAVDVLQNKIDEAGLSGGSVRVVELGDGTEFILIEVPDIDREGTIELIEERGEVNIDAYYLDEDEGEYTNRTVLSHEDFRQVGTPDAGDDVQSPHVPVTLEANSAEDFEEDVIDTNIAQPGGTNCQFETSPEQTDSCLLTVVDGEVVYSAGMSGDLAESIRGGTWSDDPSFILQTESYSEAQNLAINLRAGVMPADLDVDEGEVSFVSAEQGDQFRFIAFLVGVVASLAVATSVSLRYGNAKIAIPMLLTAFAEVVILLAIAAMLSYPIDIAVIAGFVAVIGTGVDDLIIIADRVMGGRNPASSGKIFERRFRKALWIIMSAAGTTILALGPLAVMELHELQGFAIFTIVGVIAGVLITRPAYGDMLRYFFTDEHDKK